MTTLTNTQDKESKKEKLAKHRANLDRMRYEAYINFARSYSINLKN